MFRLGLTGSIATGKSTILEQFAALGAKTFSADEAVHRLYEGPLIADIARLVPQSLIDQRIDRSHLAAALIKDPALFSQIEALVHPLVRSEIKAFMHDAATMGAGCAIVEVPLLYESARDHGFDYGFDAILVVTCSLATQRLRALARPGVTGEKLDALLARQIPLPDKVARADLVIDTDAAPDKIAAEVRAIFADHCRNTTPDGT